jgi:hypothetical protein
LGDLPWDGVLVAILVISQQVDSLTDTGFVDAGYEMAGGRTWVGKVKKRRLSFIQNFFTFGIF